MKDFIVMSARRAFLPLLLVGTLSGVSGIALGQQSEAGFALEEIVVTARKREENLQETPVSIAVFTGGELTHRQIRSTDQLGDVTPNLTFDSYAPSSGQNGSSQIYIRGIGQSDFTAVTDPGVGLYIDGVYLARSFGGSLDFLDLERIEVLRGPQGTLFGRNTIGGAIALHTRRPNDELSGSVRLDLGNDNKRFLTGSVNIPIADGFYSKFSAMIRKRDGYVDRVQLAARQLSGVAAATDGIDVGDDDTISARAAFVWEASDTLGFFLSMDYTDESENGAPTTSLGLNDEQTFPSHSNRFENGVAFGGNCPLFPPPLDPGPANSTNDNFMCINNTWRRNEFESEGNGETKSDLSTFGVSLEATWAITDSMSIKSITAYRDIDAYSARDADGTPYRVFHTQDPFDQDQFSQELQLSGATGRLDWLTGLYYFQEEATNPNPVQFPVPTLGALISGGEVDNDNFAVFAQGTYDLTERWSLTAGLRYTEETKRFSPFSFADGFYVQGPPGSPSVRYYDCPTGTEPGCGGVQGRLFTDGDRLVPAGEYTREFDATTPMVNIAYQANDDVMLYASYSEGFKSGGFDQRFINFIPEPTSFEPETAETYEIGMKSSWLGNSMRINVAAYYTDYEDIQIFVRQGFAPITFNAGTAEIKGFEFESTWIPTAEWIVQASVGYTDAEYATLDPSVASVGISINSKLPQVSEWTANVGIAYTGQLGSWSVTPRVDWSYNDDVFNNAVNTPQLFQESYHLLNAAIVAESRDGTWELALTGRNLGDETILIAGASGYSTGSGYTAGNYARQREWGVSATYKF
jgi:iron complex outermembrane receptor protein